MTYLVDHPDLSQQLSDLCSCLGKTNLRSSFPAVHAYFYCQDRLTYLQTKSKELSYLPIDNIERLNCETFIKDHIDFILSVLDRLDKHNTIDQLNDLDVLSEEDAEDFKDFKYYMEQYPKFVMDAYLHTPYKKPFTDKAAQLLIKSTYKGRHTMQLQRLLNAMRIYHDKGWFMVFHTLTIETSSIAPLMNKPTALRDFFRTCGEQIGFACGAKNITQARAFARDNYKYFCVPEYGTKNGRLHWHAIHFFSECPPKIQDPCAGVDRFGNSNRHHTELKWFSRFWKYGNSQDVPVRYTGDMWKIRKNFLIPIDKKTGIAKQLKPKEAVAYYVSKYVSKNYDTACKINLNSKIDKAKKLWRQTLKTARTRIINPKTGLMEILPLPEKSYRVRMSRNFGMELPPMNNLSMDALMEATRLHWKSCAVSMLMKRHARKEMLSRVGILTLSDLIHVLPQHENLLLVLRRLIQKKPESNKLSFIPVALPSSTNTDISDELQDYIVSNGLESKAKSRFSAISAGL